MSDIGSVFAERLLDNIVNDYYDVVIVTSRSMGRVKGSRRPFRVGKSTYALWLSYALHSLYYQFTQKKQYSDKQLWDMVFKHLFYSIYDVDKYIKKLAKKGKTAPAIILDEAERTVPAYQRIPRRLRETIENINTYGTATKFLILTAPAISDIAKPLRRIITFEIIIPRRGYYEIQEIILNKEYHNAPEEYGRYIYRGEGTFPPLPPEIDKRYQEWRRKLPAKTSNEYQQQQLPEKYVRAHIVAKLLGITRFKLYSLCEKEEIECIKQGRKVYINTETLREKLPLLLK